MGKNENEDNRASIIRYSHIHNILLISNGLLCKKKFPSNVIERCVEKMRGMMKNLKEIRVNLFNFNKALMNMDISGSKDNDIFSLLCASPFHQK